MVDYGVGNLHSVLKALEEVGARPVLTHEPDRLASVRGVILPGVGAFGAALGELEARGLRETLVELAAAGMPLFGVCLGYQLLFERSTEGGEHRGLGLLPGTVDRVQGPVKVPHMGWNRLHPVDGHPLLEGLTDGDYFYFVHSYLPVGDGDWVIARCDYGRRFAAAAARGSVCGTQFHPEKSGAGGLRIYANFARICAA
ncbi:MAG: imidazole glycerol phosphate synthase subunit HisH [Candidatus Dormibacteria bacterium]